MDNTHSVSEASLLDQVPVVGKLPPEELALRLEAMGDVEMAKEVRDEIAKSEALEGLFRVGPLKPWQHTAQQIGFVPALNDTSPTLMPILNSGDIKNDPSLKNSRINVKLDRLRVFEYPGKGLHTVMLTFKAQNQLANNAAEPVTFSHSYPIQQGQTAGVAGYPIFIGLNIGTVGAAFEFFTVNVKNEGDQGILQAMESSPFRSGLDLLTTFQPVIKPFSEIILGVATAFLKRNENVKVQKHYLGLDFSQAAYGVGLAEGNYVVAQTPSDNEINWAEWAFNRSIGAIVNRADPQATLPYNYLVFRVDRYQ
jgi:hypothetical protein